MSRPPNQRPLGEPERSLLQVYANCQLALAHPRQLYEEYAFTYDQLALIAGCSLPTMTRWMNRGQEPRLLKEVYTRRLGEFNFLLHHYQQIPPEIWEALCPLPARIRSIIYPTSE
jgi:hypothetical protein